MPIFRISSEPRHNITPIISSEKPPLILHSPRTFDRTSGWVY